MKTAGVRGQLSGITLLSAEAEGMHPAWPGPSTPPAFTPCCSRREGLCPWQCMQGGVALLDLDWNMEPIWNLLHDCQWGGEEAVKEHVGMKKVLGTSGVPLTRLALLV